MALEKELKPLNKKGLKIMYFVNVFIVALNLKCKPCDF